MFSGFGSEVGNQQEQNILYLALDIKRYYYSLKMLSNRLLKVLSLSTAAGVLFGPCSAYKSEIERMEGHTVLEDFKKPLPIDYVNVDDLPDDFSWNVPTEEGGHSFTTSLVNQHIPGYCGSCWAVGSITALADRISIARGKDAKGPKVHLSIQYILNCGKLLAGSCHGGTHTGAYHLVKAKGHIPYETCMPYLACSAESTEGFCQEAQDDFKCNAMNTCRTCSGFSDKGGECVAVESYPNATVAEYGRYSNDVDAIMAEIYARGPVAASINAEPLINYQGGVVKDHRLLHKMPNHVVAIIGWGTEKETGDKYWIGRNSWGGK